MFEKYSSLLHIALNMEGNYFCQYPSCEKLKLFELRYTSGQVPHFCTVQLVILCLYIALYRAECFIGQKIAPSYLFAITQLGSVTHVIIQ
jgi:hypothetical protein